MKLRMEDNYRLYFMSAAKALRKAANNLDAGDLGQAEADLASAVTTLRWVSEDAARKPKKGGA